MLFVLIVMGNLLALPIWWWLFGTPLNQFWKWCREGKPRRQPRKNVPRLEKSLQSDRAR